VVRRPPATPPLAGDARPVRDPRQRGDAATDPGRAGDPTLARLARAVADRARARGRFPGRRDRRLAGARLQPPGRQPASGGPARRRGRLARRPHRVAGRRPVYRGGGWQFRLRPRRAARRHERPPDPGTNRRVLRRFVHSGAVRPGRDGLPRTHTTVRRMPSRCSMPVARITVRTAPQAIGVQRVVPGAPRKGAAGSRAR
jgi:hypothetical protein